MMELELQIERVYELNYYIFYNKMLWHAEAMPRRGFICLAVVEYIMNSKKTIPWRKYSWNLQFFIYMWKSGTG